MVVTAVSTSPAASFHVVPPPPVRPRHWSEFAIAVALALLLNLALIFPFLLQNPAANPPLEEPPSISVELVPEEEAPAPVPEPEPETEEPPQSRSLTRSGPEAETTLGPETATEAAAPEAEAQAAPETAPEPEPEPQAVEKEEQTESFDIPEWARTLDTGYQVPAPVEAPEIVRSSGGDPYLNMMFDRVRNNLVYPRAAGGRGGVVRISLLVHRSGNVSDIRLVESAGHPALDRAVYEALQRSLPFAPIPPEVAENEVRLSGNIPVFP